MMPLAMLWTDIRILLVDTTRIWWRLLPKILTLFLLGEVGYALAHKLAVIVLDWSTWPALVIFAFAFVSKLAALVLILRLVGNRLGIRRLIPDDEVEDDDRDAGVTRLLALTLLPFLGIYTAFGLVAEASDQLFYEALFRQGAFGTPFLAPVRLNGENEPLSKYLTAIAIVVGTYLLRRGLDLLHERTGFRPLGIAVACVESFFVLVLLLIGGDLLAKIKVWVEDRQFVGWIAALQDNLAAALRSIGIDLDRIQELIGSVLADQVWPVLSAGLTQPIFWLAIAALVYGSSVISVAEMWRKGKPLASRIRVARRVLERQARQQAVIQPGHRSRRVAGEVREAFLGDLDDKYLPTVHSLRLILRAGVIFLGAYILVYALLRCVDTLYSWLLVHTIGGHQMSFWIVWSPLEDIVSAMPTETWRLCLLAVALRRCLIIFRMRAEAAGTVHPGAGRPLTSQQAAAEDLQTTRPQTAAGSASPQTAGAPVPAGTSGPQPATGAGAR